MSEKFEIGCSSVSEILTRKTFYKEEFKNNTGLKFQKIVKSKFGDINSSPYKLIVNIHVHKNVLMYFNVLILYPCEYMQIYAK